MTAAFFLAATMTKIYRRFPSRYDNYVFFFCPNRYVDYGFFPSRYDDYGFFLSRYDDYGKLTFS